MYFSFSLFKYLNLGSYSSFNCQLLLVWSYVSTRTKFTIVCCYSN